jgi:hypothetical protein
MKIRSVKISLHDKELIITFDDNEDVNDFIKKLIDLIDFKSTDTDKKILMENKLVSKRYKMESGYFEKKINYYDDDDYEIDKKYGWNIIDTKQGQCNPIAFVFCVKDAEKIINALNSPCT